MTTVPAQNLPLVTQFANKYAVEPAKLMATLKQTAFKQAKDGPEVSDAHMMALLVVSNEYNLNPFTREIYAFPDKSGGITPIVSVDGWLRIINQHKAFNGMEFHDHFANGNLVAITCRIFRTDREHPTEVTEYLEECKQSTAPWTKWPIRMLRHKATIQCARYAFGFAGIYDPDEGERILKSSDVEVRRTKKSTLNDDPPFANVDNSSVVEVDGEMVDMESGEIVNAKTKPATTSPAFAAMSKKLKACQTLEDIEALSRNPMMAKMTASERKAYDELTNRQVDGIEQRA